jgi:hypothetical protein
MAGSAAAHAAKMQECTAGNVHDVTLRECHRRHYAALKKDGRSRRQLSDNATTLIRVRGSHGRSHRMKLYTYWRSQASFRVRIALRLKGVIAETVSLDLLKGDQFDASYRTLNPEMVVPTLLDGEGPPLVQSLAILEYLEEKYPQPPLLPMDLRARAHVRGLAQMLAIDAHPFIVPRVRKYLEQELHLDDAGSNEVA